MKICPACIRANLGNSEFTHRLVFGQNPLPEQLPASIRAFHAYFFTVDVFFSSKSVLYAIFTVFLEAFSSPQVRNFKIALVNNNFYLLYFVKYLARRRRENLQNHPCK